MGAMRLALLIVGVLCALIGLLWIGQGFGYVRWPASSFMVDQRVWANYGSALTALGLLLILVARRLRVRRR